MRTIVSPFTQEGHSESLVVMKGKSTHNQKDDGCGMFHQEGSRRWRRGGTGFSTEWPVCQTCPAIGKKMLDEVSTWLMLALTEKGFKEIPVRYRKLCRDFKQLGMPMGEIPTAANSNKIQSTFEHTSYTVNNEDLILINLSSSQQSQDEFFCHYTRQTWIKCKMYNQILII